MSHGITTILDRLSGEKNEILKWKTLLIVIGMIIYKIKRSITKRHKLNYILF